MNAHRGSVRPRGTDDPAVLLAGALAESGIARLTLRVPGSADAELHARNADLPGLLRAAMASAGRAELIDPDRGASVRLSPGWVEWSGADEHLHAALAAIGAHG